MANKEINALPTSTNLNPTDWFHVKQGAIDVKMDIGTILDDHINSANPHGVTKSQVGLGAVLDVEQLEKAQNLADLPSALTARTNLGVYSTTETQTQIDLHANLTTNPHSVTKAQVGLANVANYTTTDDPRENDSTKYATGAAVATLAGEHDTLALSIMPKGSIIMWSQNAGAIPSGFALCNGQTIGGIVTPNLTGKFIKASDLPSTGTTGGSNSVSHTHSGSADGHSITLTEMPAHKHASGVRSRQKVLSGATGAEACAPDPTFTGTVGDPSIYTNIVGGDGIAEGVSDPHTHSITMDNAVIATEPEYYSLAFIIKYI